MNSLINLNVHIVIINSNLYNNYKHFTNAILIKTTLMNVMKTSNNFKEIYNGNNKHKNNIIHSTFIIIFFHIITK